MFIHTKTGTRPATCCILLALGLLLVSLSLAPRAARADGVVNLIYFYDPNCSSCAELYKEVIEPLQQQYGASLAIDKRDLTDPAVYAQMLAYENAYGVTSGGIPEIFIGKYALAGDAEIRAALQQRIEEYLPTGVPLPELAGDQPTSAPSPTPASTSAARQAFASAKVNILLFYSPTCPHCHELMTNILPPLMQKYGADLQVRIVDISSDAGNVLWSQFMTAAGVPDDAHYVPMLVIGNHLMIGSDSPQEKLDGLIAEYLASQEGAPYLMADWLNDSVAPVFSGPSSVQAAANATPPATTSPTAPVSSTAVINAAYFYQDGCDVCERAGSDLAYLEQKYPQLKVRRINIKEGTALNQYLCNKYGVPEALQLTAPMLFIGSGYLAGDNVRAQNIEKLLAPYLASGAPEPWAGYDANAAQAEQAIIERFRSFGILAVLGAGLLDGINPCAFATIIFLLSYLAVRKRFGRELLLTGLAFTVGVFLAYLLVGLGLFRALTALPFMNVISKWLYGITAAICLVLAVGSLRDAARARQGRLEEMSLTLPKRLRGVTHRMIRQGSASKWYVPASFMLGMVVSLIELACTGQVYLPTIIFVMGVPELRSRALLTLILYNIMFIVPLVVVFLLCYFGTTSQQLTAWMQKHTATVKTVMAVFFVVMAAWLAYNIVA